MTKKRLTIIHTGGTILSEADSEGILSPAAGGISSAIRGILSYLSNKTFGGFEITEKNPYSILSENLVPENWEQLITCIYEEPESPIIITHGTDTLSWTAAFLAQILRNYKYPVFLIAANHPFDHSDSNGPDNLNAALSVIKDGYPPGVYVPYKNPGDREVTIHKGEQIVASPDFADFFCSAKQAIIPNRIYQIHGSDFHKKILLEKSLYVKRIEEESLHENIRCNEDLHEVSLQEEIRREESRQELGQHNDIIDLSAKILVIRPYPGINYDSFDIKEADAVLHGSFHSFAAGSAKETGLYDFAKKLQKANKNLYFAPILSENDKIYESTKEILEWGLVKPIFDMTMESAYAYLLIKYSRNKV